MPYILLQEAAEATGRQFPVYFTIVYVVGFIAAVAIGSIAWYNSKRPPGWEQAERPDWVPDVDKTEVAEASKTEETK